MVILIHKGADNRILAYLTRKLLDPLLLRALVAILDSDLISTFAGCTVLSVFTVSTVDTVFTRCTVLTVLRVA